jgi:hypothetical protein
VTSILLFVATYLVAREAVHGWSTLCILVALTGVLILTANIAGLEQTITYVAGSKLSFKPTGFDNTTVILSASLMLIAQKICQAFRSGR